jgi:preprotein translocase subunit SecY
LVVFGFVALAVLAAIVFIEKAQRRIPVNYAQKQQGRRVFTAQQTHLPLKINMAGVIPAIFASSLLLFPASLGNGWVVLIRMRVLSNVVCKIWHWCFAWTAVVFGALWCVNYLFLLFLYSACI